MKIDVVICFKDEDKDTLYMAIRVNRGFLVAPLKTPDDLPTFYLDKEFYNLFSPQFLR